MSTALHDDVSSGVLRRMKEGGFDFASFHPIEFYAIFPDEERARQATRNFRGESLHALVTERDDGAWHLQVSKVMYATHAGIGDFEHGFCERKIKRDPVIVFCIAQCDCVDQGFFPIAGAVFARHRFSGCRQRRRDNRGAFERLG